MTKQLKLWQGQFGDDYTKRNELTSENLQARFNLWVNILGTIGPTASIPKQVLEVGAGTGGNLKVIGDIYKINGLTPSLYAVEPNASARAQLEAIDNCKVVSGDAFGISASDGAYDMAFTSGVLIHIHPDDLLKAMKEIYRTTKKYIVCIEYFSPEPREIKYRGQDEALWTRDYGSMWMDNFPLRCINYGFTWKRATGLDNVTWWSFEKVN